MGAVAGFCTTFAFVPQVVKIYKQGGRDLSYGMLSLHLGGVLLWLANGILSHAEAVTLTNAATAILTAVATVLKAWKERQGTTKRLVSDQLTPQPHSEGKTHAYRGIVSSRCFALHASRRPKITASPHP